MPIFLSIYFLFYAYVTRIFKGEVELREVVVIELVCVFVCVVPSGGCVLCDCVYFV